MVLRRELTRFVKWVERMLHRLKKWLRKQTGSGGKASIASSVPTQIALPQEEQPSIAIKQRATGQDVQQVGQVFDGGIVIRDVAGSVYFGVKPPQPGYPFQAPPLPNPFVDRPEHRLKVKQELLSDEERRPGTLVVSAIAGLGGIGKTVLASALAHDADVQARFTDGILWVSLGQAPDLLSLVDSWIRELKDYDYKPTTVETASMHLRTLLYDKKMLLVVDDVWNPEHAEPFRVGGAGCQVLVTTREAKIAGASRYELDVMTEAEAINLLARSLPEPLNTTEQAQALALAREVGYLPLALQLAAGQIEDGVSWSDLLHDLRAEVARLETLDALNATTIDETQRRKYSLLASFNLSLRQLTPEQLQQFAWLGVLPEDVLITQPMAATLWEVTPRQAGAVLRTMKSKALLLSGPKQGEQQTFRLHDLMHDCAQRLLRSSLTPEQADDLPGLGLTRPAAHAALLERYRHTTTDGQWYSLPDDGYIYAHLK